MFEVEVWGGYGGSFFVLSVLCLFICLFTLVSFFVFWEGWKGGREEADSDDRKRENRFIGSIMSW